MMKQYQFFGQGIEIPEATIRLLKRRAVVLALATLSVVAWTLAVLAAWILPTLGGGHHTYQIYYGGGASPEAVLVTRGIFLFFLALGALCAIPDSVDRLRGLWRRAGDNKPSGWWW